MYMPGILNEGEIAVKQGEAMKATRANYEPIWSEISENMFPMKSMYTGHYPGARIGSKMYDSTAQISISILAAQISAALTPSQETFFIYEPYKKEMKDNWEAKRYCQHKQEVMWEVIASSNFQSQILQLFLDEVLFGNGVIYTESHSEYVVNYSSRDLSEVYYDVDQFGYPDTVARYYKASIRNIVQDFGIENCSDEIKQKYLNTDYQREQIEMLHLVRPNAYYEPGKLGLDGFRYESIYVDPKNKHIFEQSGYHEMPYAIGRWFVVSGETYGRGPAECALPDVRNLHVMNRHYVRATQKATDPALLLPQKAFLGTKLNLAPGKLNFYRATGIAGGTKDLIGTFPGGDRAFPASAQDLQRIRDDVKRGLFVDKVQLVEKDRMTRAEVIQRTEQDYNVLAPILGRNNTETLSPILDRTEAIIERAGLFEPMPEFLKMYGGIKRTFKSPLIRAQKLQSAQGFVSAMDVVTPLAQIDPEILKIIKRDETLRYIFDSFGASADLLETPEETRKRNEAEQQAAAEQQQFQMGLEGTQAMAGATADIAKATKDLGGIERVGGLM